MIDSQGLREEQAQQSEATPPRSGAWLMPARNCEERRPFGGFIPKDALTWPCADVRCSREHEVRR